MAGRRRDPRHAWQAREIRLHAAAPTGQDLGDRLADRPLLVGADLEQRLAVLGQGAVTQPLQELADHRQPVRPAVERHPRLERGGHRQRRDDVAAHVRQVREDEVERRLDIRRQEVRLQEAHAIRRGVAHGVLPREVQRLGRKLRGEDHELVANPVLAQDDGECHGHRPAPRPDVGDPDRRRTGRPVASTSAGG